jgi:PAS domain S-box-containing protein
MRGLVHFLRNSVRGRLALLVLAITAPALVLVLLLTVQSYRNESAAVGRHLLANVRALAALVDDQIKTSEALLEGLAVSRALDAGDFEWFDARTRALVGDDDRWVVLADATGQQLVNTRVPRGWSLPRHDFDGEFAEAMHAGRHYISNIVPGPMTGQPVFFVAVPVMRGGQLLYTLSLAMTPAVFAEIVNPARFAEGTVVVVLDRAGVVAARHPNGERYVGGKAAPDLVTAALGGAEGLQKCSTLEGDVVLAAHSRGLGSGWTVILGAPFDSLYASARRLLWLGLSISAVLMTLAIFVATWIGRSLVRSVDSLVADTETIGRGAVPAERSSGLLETDYVVEAMLKTARRLSERERDNANLTAALQAELEKQKRAEETSRRLAAIVESSDDAIISTDLDGIVTSWNGGAERIYGYTPQEIVARSVTVLLPASRSNEEQTILERIRRGERIEHFETLRRRKDGTEVAVSLTVSPLYAHDGRVIGASKIARDVTPRVHAEAQQHALYELVARVNRAEALPEIYEAALDAMCRSQEADRAAILLCDGEGVMRFKAWRGLSDGYRRAVEGHSPWAAGETNPQIVCIEDVAKAAVSPEVRRAVDSEGIRALAFIPLTYEKRLIGKFMVYYAAPRTFPAPMMRPVEAIASQVAFAIERRQGAEALEALVDERTASLRQVVAQMEEFSYSVSHDLRAPVRAMRGFAEIILQDHAAQLSDAGRDLLSRIMRNSARMDRLIQDLLTYSRISRRELQLEPVSLDKLVSEVVQQYPDMRPDRADIEVQGPLPDVLAHEPSLTQVISNLLSNAVKFVPPQARPKVRIGYDANATQARLWFQDNGIGIKPEHQKRLFGMFERVHPEKAYEGTGIGLAIVRKAVERMNGAVGVESDGVTGSKFWFELPIAPQPGTPTTEARTNATAQQS